MIFLLSADIGRCPISSLSDQSCIELLGSGFEKQEWCKRESGDFKDMDEIDGVKICPEGLVTVLKLNNMGLKGKLQMQFLPSRLEKVGNNRFEGQVSLGSFPKTIKRIFVHKNAFFEDNTSVVCITSDHEDKH